MLIKIKRVTTQGSILMYTLVFTSIFLVITAGLVSYSLAQYKLTNKKISKELALHIAEAGINYYRWHLAHDPSDYMDNTGLPGPYVHDYGDPFGGNIGQFSLEVTPPSEYSNVVGIKSTGWTLQEPGATRTVEVQYGRPTLSDFAFLTNSSTWFGENEELHGPIHSNGGIRMDGEHYSTLASAVTTYICDPIHGCNNQTKPGIWGSGGNPALWEFPDSNIDFNVLTVDMAELKSQAQNNGIYLPPSGLGYHIVFQADSSLDLYQVDSLESPVSSYDGDQWITDSYDILSESFIQSYSLSSTSTIIFVEDDVWVNGDVRGRITLATAVLPDIPNTNTSVYIGGDLLYTAKDGTDVLGIMAQKNILVPLYMAPDNLEINAVLLAQKGHVFRNYYPSSYSPYHLRNSISLYGSIITNTIWTWRWVNSSQQPSSGYISTLTTYDPFLTFAPPPSFPLSGEYQFIKWKDNTDK